MSAYLGIPVYTQTSLRKVARRTHAAMASTAQGCASLECDYSAKDPKKRDPANLPNDTHWLAPVNWRFWAGSQDIAVYVRKHRPQQQLGAAAPPRQASYVIIASIQPQSNYIGNTNVSVNATIQLNPTTQLTFTVWRQGSTYALTMDGAPHPSQSGGGGRVRSFVQLDKWHSHKHPSFWPRDFTLEGELHDESRPATAASVATSDVHTENTVVISTSNVMAEDKPTAAGVRAITHYDMRTAVSYLRLHGGAQPVARTWTFEPRPVDPVTGQASSTQAFVLLVRARSSRLLDTSSPSSSPSSL